MGKDAGDGDWDDFGDGALHRVVAGALRSQACSAGIKLVPGLGLSAAQSSVGFDGVGTRRGRCGVIGVAYRFSTPVA
jgi:hypothetical protein